MPKHFSEDLALLIIDEMDAEERDYVTNNSIDNAIRALEESLNDPLDPME